MSNKIAVVFQVRGMTLRTKHSTILYSGSEELYAQFIFDDFWGEIQGKHCVFRVKDKWYKTAITTTETANYCKIPYQAIKNEGHIQIGVMSDNDILSTNLLPLDVYQGTYKDDITYIDVDVPPVPENEEQDTDIQEDENI